MRARVLGRTGRQVSEVGLGCWQLGADWGQVSPEDAMDTLRAAADAGVTFLDTADVYGDGRSEQLVGRLLRERSDDGLFVATKMGRRADPHVPESFTGVNLRAWNDRSRRNLGMDTLDLVQLHCPPTAVLSDDRLFDELDAMVSEGRMQAYGVSVETVDEALTAIARPHVASIQIILNVFRRKPLEAVLPAAERAGVGIVARVPLASGLLSGAYDEHTTFAADDHRSYNRSGQAFDVGETFAGVPFEVGVAAAREVAALTPAGASTAQLALRWVLDQPGVSVVIPGARNRQQAQANAAAAELAATDEATSAALRSIYDRRIREHVHARW
ncbi:aldo/keto reductase [Angustibacter sp. McL0619]|uniref:aldo/keto reductase n=1 Tax=Angustibacter sp. McL0619 TaxID=3415676 RepID=UPI003CEBB484